MSTAQKLEAIERAGFRPEFESIPLPDEPSTVEKLKGPSKLELTSARELVNMELSQLRWTVSDIMCQGLGLVVAPSKYGKSWLMLLLCKAVASGGTFLGYHTHKGEVLYLALEDGLRRLQSRLNTLLTGEEVPNGLYLATAALTLGTGLEQQIKIFIDEHPKTVLIVIDVLERIRSARNGRTSAYTSDYQDMGALKAIADKYEISIVLIHHTRKMKDESDAFNAISGTNGLMGAADTIWVLQRDKRDDEITQLHIIGRDVEAQDLVLKMNGCRWEKIGTTEEQAEREEARRYVDDPIVVTIGSMLKEQPCGVEITASDFFVEMGKRAGDYGVYTPTSLGKAFVKLAPHLLRYDNIVHTYNRTTKKRTHTFLYRSENQVSYVSLLSEASYVSQVSLEG